MKKLIVLIFILVTTSLYAAEYPYIMKSVRALGMGNSYYTLSDDQYGMFYNPAGLARIEGWRAEILNPQIEFGTDAKDFYDDATDTDWDKEDEIADLLRAYIGENQHIGFSAFPAFYMKNFAIGVFANVRGNIVAGNPAYPTLDTEIYVDRGLSAGYAMSFLKEDALQIGVSVKYLIRSSLKTTYTVADLTKDFDDLVDDDLKKGSGIIGDIGAIYNFRSFKKLDPRVGLSVNNIGMTDLGDAEDLETTLNLSMAISPSFGPIGTHFLLELHDATRSFDEDDDWPKRMHAGAELNFLKKRLAIRAGVNQGYITLGAGVDLTFFKVDYAYYTEEIGAYAGQWDDERHVIQVTIGF